MACGGPEIPLRWTCCSAASLEARLEAEGRKASGRAVNRLPHGPGCSLQANRRTVEGRRHPDRDAQFRRTSRRIRAFQKPGQPAVSADTKKKELAGRFRNGRRGWHPKGSPVAVNVRGFPDPEPGKAILCGACGMTASSGRASVGIASDTSEFAAGTVRRWWKRMGSPLCPDARRLRQQPQPAVEAGDPAPRRRAGPAIPVRRFPPGASKRNRIGHRMFRHITRNRRGKPPVSHEAIVNLIAATATKTGPAIRSEAGGNECATGIKVTDDRMNGLSVRSAGFHGEWNCTLLPSR